MRTAVFVSVLVGLAAGVARADDGIALEVYTGERSADANRLIGPVLSELAAAKMTSGDSIARLFESAVSSPSRTEKGLPSDFAQQADNGLRMYAEGKFQQAIQALTQLIDVSHQNSGAFAKDSRLLEPLQKAMIALALAHSRNGDQGAMHATFEEMLHTFPTATVSRAVYGPDAGKAFEETRALVAAKRTGKLTVRASTGSVFINETYRNSGSQTLELAPGEYRVVVIANDQPSRTHYVTVRSGGEAVVVVDPAYDQAVHTTGWTGFQFARAKDREEHEAAYANQFAHELGMHSVALVGIDQAKGHSQVVGSLISLESGREIRKGLVALDPDPSRERLRELAKYVIGEATGSGIEVVDVSKLPVPSKVDHEPGGEGNGTGANGGNAGGGGGGDVAAGTTVTVDRRWAGWQWISLGATAGLVGTGAVLAAIDGQCKGPPPVGRPCTDVYVNHPGYWYAFGAAVPFAALTAYLFVTQHKTVDARTAFIAPTGDGAVAGYAFTW